jgi:transcriptional regulator GlxA family with amidase domain
MEITATTSFADAPPLDLLLVPGGPGQISLMKHSVLLDYIRTCSQTAQWICSVCTGALLLAQAGVLKGRRATTHWLARDALRSFDVDVSGERYVIDGKFATAAGGTAGIDLALELARRTAGDAAVEEIQLQLEHEAGPPLGSGLSERATPELVSRLRSTARRFR